MLDNEDKKLLEIVADMHEVPMGAYNIRKNGKSVMRNSSEHIIIETNEDNTGINIHIKDGTKNESVHIPVLLAESGLVESVRNDFYVGKNCDVVIVAGCGIHNTGKKLSEHSGVHRFFIKENSKVKYIEKHYGYGSGGDRVINPSTVVNIGDNSSFDMNTVQISGIDTAMRRTEVVLGKNATLNISEKILTENNQNANTLFVADLEGENSSCHIVSRAVAKGSSVQSFKSVLNGKNKCFGHTECDAIVMDNSKVFATPEVNALSTDASLIHEAAIGKIAGEQIIKLKTLGLTEQEAENLIINGFLK